MSPELLGWMTSILLFTLIIIHLMIAGKPGPPGNDGPLAWFSFVMLFSAQIGSFAMTIVAVVALLPSEDPESPDLEIFWVLGRLGVIAFLLTVCLVRYRAVICALEDRLGFRCSEYFSAYDGPKTDMARHARRYYHSAGFQGPGGSVRVYDLSSLSRKFIIRHSRCWVDPGRPDLKSQRFRQLYGVASGLNGLGFGDVLFYPMTTSDKCLLSATQSSGTEGGQEKPQCFFLIDFAQDKLSEIAFGAQEMSLAEIANPVGRTFRFCSDISPSGELITLRKEVAVIKDGRVETVLGGRPVQRTMIPASFHKIMSLPSEVRGMIYDLLLEGGHVVLKGADISPRYVVERWRSGLALLLVARHASREFHAYLEDYVASLQRTAIQRHFADLALVREVEVLCQRRRLSLLFQRFERDWSLEDIVDNAFASVDAIAAVAYGLGIIHVLVAIESWELNGMTLDAVNGAASMSDAMVERIENHIAQRTQLEINFKLVVLVPIKGSSSTATWYGVRQMLPRASMIAAFRAGHKTALLDMLASGPRIELNPFVLCSLLWSRTAPEVCRVADERKLESMMPESSWDFWSPPKDRGKLDRAT